jgi:hypothetical protein
MMAVKRNVRKTKTKPTSKKVPRSLNSLNYEIKKLKKAEVLYQIDYGILENKLFEAEQRLAILEKKYNEVRDRLTACLSKEQIDILDTFPMSPELYAINWLEIHKDTLLGFEKLKQRGINIYND